MSVVFQKDGMEIWANKPNIETKRIIIKMTTKIHQKNQMQRGKMWKKHRNSRSRSLPCARDGTAVYINIYLCCGHQIYFVLLAILSNPLVVSSSWWMMTNWAWAVWRHLLASCQQERERWKGVGRESSEGERASYIRKRWFMAVVLENDPFGLTCDCRLVRCVG